MLRGITAAVLMTAATVAMAADEIWHIKAIDDQGKTLDVKAFTDQKPDDLYNVKAIRATDDNGHKMLDIKVLHKSGKQVAHVKTLKAKKDLHDVKGVTDKGDIFHIKAFTEKGEKLDIKSRDIKGISDIKAIGKNGDLYAVKAISPDGQVYDVKSINVSDGEMEVELGKINYHSHIKAVPQG